jgi:hypothetical protein
LATLIIGYLTAIWLVPSPSQRAAEVRPTVPAEKHVDVDVPADRPPLPPDGLDPLEQLLMRHKEKVANLEDRLARTERVVAVQIRQIRQLQRISFGLGAVGDPQLSSPVETPPELKDSFNIGAIGDAPPEK